MNWYIEQHQEELVRTLPEIINLVRTEYSHRNDVEELVLLAAIETVKTLQIPTIELDKLRNIKFNVWQSLTRYTSLEEQNTTPINLLDNRIQNGNQTTYREVLVAAHFIEDKDNIEKTETIKAPYQKTK